MHALLQPVQLFGCPRITHEYRTVTELPRLLLFLPTVMSKLLFVLLLMLAATALAHPIAEDKSNALLSSPPSPYIDDQELRKYLLSNRISLRNRNRHIDRSDVITNRSSKRVTFIADNRT